MKARPEFWQCGGRSIGYHWGFGWWTGPQGDLLCVRPNVQTNIEADLLYLSPICRSHIGALLAFLVKRLLLRGVADLEAAEEGEK